MMLEPLVSVLTITWNNKRDLQTTVESVLAQNYKNLELIIVDGASRDGTRDYLASLQRENVRWISEPDSGISDAYNKAINLAKGDTCIFMNSGDTFLDAETVTRAMNLIPAGVKVAESVIYGDYYQVVDSELYFERADHTQIYSTCSINHQSAFIGGALCKRFAYDTRLKLEADYDYWMRLLAAGVPFIKIDTIIAKYDMSGISSSSPYQVHQAILRYILVALNTKRKLSVWDGFHICWRAIRVQARITVRSLVGRSIILKFKKTLISLGLKKGPVNLNQAARTG